MNLHELTAFVGAHGAAICGGIAIVLLVLVWLGFEVLVRRLRDDMDDLDRGCREIRVRIAALDGRISQLELETDKGPEHANVRVVGQFESKPLVSCRDRA